MSATARTAANSNTAARAALVAATPMMAQYWSLKDKAGDCLLFYRMGDFFELFFDDAKAAASTLDIALTSRGEHGGAPVPMCGVPVHSAESYLARLIKAGHRVATHPQEPHEEEARERHDEEDVTAGVVSVAANPGQTHRDPLGETLALDRQQWGVGGGDDDDRPPAGRLIPRRGNLHFGDHPAEGDSVDPKVISSPGSQLCARKR